jgi:hypothetical protein
MSLEETEIDSTAIEEDENNDSINEEVGEVTEAVINPPTPSKAGVKKVVALPKKAAGGVKKAVKPAVTRKNKAEETKIEKKINDLNTVMLYDLHQRRKSDKRKKDVSEEMKEQLSSFKSDFLGEMKQIFANSEEKVESRREKPRTKPRTSQAPVTFEANSDKGGNYFDKWL